MVATENWRVSAQCRNADPDRLFVKGAKQQEARVICRGCPVLTQCLSYALDERVEFGVWGGLTERERRAMLKARPDIACWSSFLNQVLARRTAAAGSATVPATASGSVPVVVVPMAPVAARQDVRLVPAALSRAA